MSSMTDIVSYYSSFFMLTSTLVGPNALEIIVANSKSKTLEKQTISISITKDIRFYINDTVKDALEQLKLIVNNEQEPGIILHTDKSVDIEHVVKVMDIAYRINTKLY